MIYIPALLIVLIGAAVCLSIYRIQAESDDSPSTRQRRALKRHHREQDRERKRVAKLWKQRGKVIRPNA